MKLNKKIIGWTVVGSLLGLSSFVAYKKIGVSGNTPKDNNKNEKAKNGHDNPDKNNALGGLTQEVIDKLDLTAFIPKCAEQKVKIVTKEKIVWRDRPPVILDCPKALPTKKKELGIGCHIDKKTGTVTGIAPLGVSLLCLRDSKNRKVYERFIKKELPGRMRRP